MTNVGGQAPGWYYAQGDPVGTQRYWDGTQWVGGPQTAQPSAGVEAPAVGQVGYSTASSVGASSGAAASFGKRAVAFIIDSVISSIVVAVALVAVGLVLRFASVDAESATAPLLLVTGLAAFIFWLWNQVIRQGKTGQTIGKKMQQIKLVSDATGQPVGAGGAFLRQLVAGAISGVTCGIGALADYLWPLFDADGKRLTDKVMKFHVVAA